MAQFITRVELHGAGHDEPIYQILHASMEAAGFKRTIFGQDNKNYHLPTAEYKIIGNYKASDVMTKAITAASKTNKEFSAITSEATNIIIYNLKPA